MLIVRNIIITFTGILLYSLTYVYPLFKMVYFDWIAIIVMMLPWILDVWNMKTEDTLLQTDTAKKWETIVDYIDRNRDVYSLKTNKPYHTQSFLEAEGFGLIENKGKDSVLKKGRKKYVLALENCEHTPDPDMLTASEILYVDMGFRNTDVLKRVLSGKYLTAGDYKVMGQAMIAMMTFHTNHGGRKLVEEWKNYEGETQTFKPKQPAKKIPQFQDISQSVDKILSKYKKGD